MIKPLTFIKHKWDNRNSKHYFIKAVISTVFNVNTTHIFTVTYQYGKFDPLDVQKSIMKEVSLKHYKSNGIYPEDSEFKSLTISLLK